MSVKTHLKHPETGKDWTTDTLNQFRTSSGLRASIQEHGVPPKSSLKEEFLKQAFKFTGKERFLYMQSYGEIAYDAYVAAHGGVSLISGEKLPAFTALKPEIQQAWGAAADAVIAATINHAADAGEGR